MSQFPMDVDAEAIFLDGAWYTREDLSRRIRAMLDSGDFNVARPSLALQELTQMMQGVQTMAFRAPPELADALSDLASRMGQSVGSVIREAVTQYITDQTSAPPAQQQAAPLQLTQPRETTQVAAMPLPPTSTTSEDLPKVVVAEVVAAPVIAGPGALKAAGVGDPVELTQKKAGGETTPESSEQRWFKQ
jgi:hypothetical protein